MIVNGITLRNPDWGDSFSIDPPEGLQIYRTRGGDRYTYIKRPGYTYFTWDIGFNHYDDILSLFNSLKDNMAESITIVDWAGNTWINCRILTNPFSLVGSKSMCTPTLQAGETHQDNHVNIPEDFNTEGYSITIEFMGVLDES